MEETSSIIILTQTDNSIAKTIYLLFQKSYPIEAKLIGVESFPPLERSLKEIQNSKTIFLGYYYNGDLAGIAEIELMDRLLDINSFVVSPSFFRQGIGSKLLKHLLTTLSFESAVVETASANQPAILLYKKFGFIEVKNWMTDIGIEKVMLSLQH